MTHDGEAGRGPLHGVRVIEAGQMIAGPFCGHLFADYGAEVIKVEAPGQGDVMRRWGGRYKGLGLYWPLIAREKKSVTLDLRQPEGQELLRGLLPTADVLVENFRPGTLEKWGLGWEEARRLNPRLVMVRVTGYGQTGPYKDKAGFGAIGEAMSGFRYLSGEPGRPPVRVGVSIGDALAATHGFIGAMLALYARDPHYAAREMVISVPEPALDGEEVRMQGVVPKLSDTPARITRGAPLLGEHNDEIWGALVGPERLAGLRRRGVV